MLIILLENGPCPEEGALQLTPVYPNEDAIGRLEICHNGHWGSICNDFTAGSGIAPLACKQLGYSVPGIYMCIVLYSCYTSYISCYHFKV